MNTVKEFARAAGEWTHLSMHSSLGGFFHYAKEIGLSPTHLGALMKISRGGTRKVASLGDDLGVTSAASSQMLDRFVSMGLVTRTEDPEDRRSKRVELTALGMKTVSRGVAARHGWIERVASRMSEKEIEAALETFKILVMKAKELDLEEGRDL
jgi:DNA-binding MarR family transcriptional regulator